VIRNLLLLLLGSVVVSHVCAQPSSPQRPALKDVYKDAFYIGAAINRAQIYGEDARGVKIVKEHFNSITPENVLKWESVHPKPNTYDFAAADKFVEFGQQNGLIPIGHTLVWHNQTPKWVFEDDKGNPISREALIKRMRDHIHRVVGRYKGRIKAWDVVNEALDEDGTLRQSPWMKIIGEDYIEMAFRYAHEADPKAELYYNDYSLENAPKRKGAVELIKKLKAKAVPVYGVGLQGHDNLDWPTAEQQDEAISAFEQLGMKVSITELDITVLPSPTKQQTAEITTRAESTAELNPYKRGLPDSVQQKLSGRYAELFKVFFKHRESIDRVTFWGVTDEDSWKNDWPAKGRTDYPLLFDRNGVPKPAFEAVISVAKTANTRN
jgi:endo-1,4-beta-xylanase